MKKSLIIVASVMMLMLGVSSAWADGTAPGTDIDNSATLSYSAGGTAQKDVTSNTDTFKVDRKIDMVLVTTDTDQQSGAFGEQNVTTNYSFKNEGNDAQHFKFEVSNLTNASDHADYDNDDDKKDVSDMSIEYSTDDGSSWDALPDSGILNVDKDAKVKLRVKATLPTASNASDGDIMNIELKSTVYKDDDSGKLEQTDPNSDDTKDQVDIVYADGVADSTLGDSNNSYDNGATKNNPDTAKDGIELARSGYIIQSPVLTLNKTSCVYSDPVNGTTHPKRIPGATILYMLDLENTGSDDASGITLKDTLQSDLDGATVKSGKDQTADKVTVDTNVDSCSCSNGSLSGSGSDSDDKDSDAQKIEVQDIAVAQSKHTCVSFTVDIK